MIHLDLTSGTPPFTQIKRQIIDQISRGQLPVGEKLPYPYAGAGTGVGS